MSKIVDNSNIGYVSEKPSLKDRLKFKYNFEKRDLKYRLANIKEQFILRFIMPQFLDYVRDVIIAKGLNPDKDPFVKQIKPTNVVENLAATFDQINSGSTRGKRTYFDHYVPKWVSDSFRDSTKHILYRNRNKPLPVEEKPQSIEVTVGVTDDPISDRGFIAIKNFRDAMENLTDKFPIDTEGNIVATSLDTAEKRADARKEIIETVQKDLKKKRLNLQKRSLLLGLNPKRRQ